ncbi:protein of unknown function [Lishizhenia tianjinensis]|uniref:DUF4421 domain-containing protein n=1 Tax=Lishizhenia tianjinensis TaxID=477690 RepID=A0A1I6Y7S4_9FLAO|nr:DUF4421 family protein [Lishizhenia tianjinensis]SFT46569.1 protein of unknown function [Lishizhenia tianjinensis]
MKKGGGILAITLSLLVSLFVRAQELPYEMHKDRIIVHPSMGFRTAPFSLKSEFNQEIDRINFRPNLNAIAGIGMTYKWISFNLRFKLPGYLRNTDKFGKTEYLDLSASFPWKGWFFNGNLNTYRGFAIKNAANIDASLGNQHSNNKLQNSTQNSSISIAAWKFFNPEFKVKPAMGIAGRYTAQAHSFYVKPTIDVHGVSDPEHILPYQFFDTTVSVYRAQNLSSIDMGAVPGFAYVNNINGWQYGGWAGVGGVLQTKFFSADKVARGFIGLSPRVDINLKGGYNVDDWFVMLNAQYNNKRIRFNQLSYRQSYYSFTLTGGYRFKYKKRKKDDA